MKQQANNNLTHDVKFAHKESTKCETSPLVKLQNVVDKSELIKNLFQINNTLIISI